MHKSAYEYLGCRKSACGYLGCIKSAGGYLGCIKSAGGYLGCRKSACGYLGCRKSACGYLGCRKSACGYLSCRKSACGYLGCRKSACGCLGCRKSACAYLGYRKSACGYFLEITKHLEKKFSTYARVRSYRTQLLTSEFYMHELFNSYKILTLCNFYHYTTACELMKILKYGYPQALATSFSLSAKNHKNFILLPADKNYQFHYKSSVILNELVNKTQQIPSVYEINTDIFKSKLKTHLLEQQKLGNEILW